MKRERIKMLGGEARPLFIVNNLVKIIVGKGADLIHGRIISVAWTSLLHPTSSNFYDPWMWKTNPRLWYHLIGDNGMPALLIIKDRPPRRFISGIANLVWLFNFLGWASSFRLKDRVWNFTKSPKSYLIFYSSRNYLFKIRWDLEYFSERVELEIFYRGLGTDGG